MASNYQSAVSTDLVFSVSRDFIFCCFWIWVSLKGDYCNRKPNRAVEETINTRSLPCNLLDENISD